MGFEWEDMNTLIGAGSTAITALPGVGPMAGLINSAVGLTSGAEATSNSSGTDQGLNAASVAAGIAGLPLQLAQMAGMAGGTEAGIGGACTMGGGAAALGGAAAAGAVASAGLAGYGVGGLAAKAIDMDKSGIFGTDPDTGKPMTAFDAAAADGRAVDAALGGGTLGTIGGAATAGVMSIVNAPRGLGAAAATGIMSLFGGGDSAAPASAAAAPEDAQAS